MRLRLLSDLHLEFHFDSGKEFIANQNDNDYDLLILAGDITLAKKLAFVFGEFRRVCGSRPIIFIPGNHEYYDSSYRKVWNILNKCQEQDSKLFVLDNKTITLDGVRFLGTTLWFSHSGDLEPWDHAMNDFKVIHGIRKWIHQQGKDSIEFLENHLQEGDIVISHHLPSYKSVHKNFKDSNLNRYFVHNIEPLIKDSGAKYWFHGHTHYSVDYMLGQTRVICNPFGYAGREINPDFQEKFLLEVE